MGVLPFEETLDFCELLRFSTENSMAKGAQNCSAAVVLKILIMDDHGLYIEIEQT